MTSMLPVLIEVRATRSTSITASRLARNLNLPNGIVDLNYSPMPVPPPTRSHELSLQAAKDQLFALRGNCRQKQIEKLRAHPAVLDVHFDTQVAPFDSRYGQCDCDDWLVDVAAAQSPDVDPPRYDCNPTQPHGCLLDVATFLGADQIWQDGVHGAGVVIGVVDGGILAEGRVDPDLPGAVPRVIDGWPDSDWGTTASWRGHGNMMAIDALGMAPRALLFDIRIVDSSCDRAYITNAIAGIQWAIEKYRKAGTPQVLCCGWGVYQKVHDPAYATDIHHPLTRKIVEAMDEGILVVFAAGNGGRICPATWCGSDGGPGKSIWGANGHPRVMTVGAANSDAQLIGYSGEGPAALDQFKPDFCGVSHFAGYFCSDTGTSAACAVTAGVVALFKQARPNLTQEATKRLLCSTAKRLGTRTWSHHSGSGVIQAKDAYDLLSGHNPPEWIDVAGFEQLKMENLRLRELFVELALNRQRRQAGRSNRSHLAHPVIGHHLPK